MAGVGGLLLAICCIAIVALGLGLATASWGQTGGWASRIAAGAAITVGAACLCLAALHSAADALALLP
ncbi:hypothetical protein [Streptomyces longwoodensis]|uniref:hypothetical protein n=1 Tax=Streptomyces longwoodensis TaxID=68231 RepID=UPI0036EBDFD4